MNLNKYLNRLYKKKVYFQKYELEFDHKYLAHLMELLQTGHNYLSKTKLSISSFANI